MDKKLGGQVDALHVQDQLVASRGHVDMRTPPSSRRPCPAETKNRIDPREDSVPPYVERIERPFRRSVHLPKLNGGHLSDRRDAPTGLGGVLIHRKDVLTGQRRLPIHPCGAPMCPPCVPACRSAAHVSNPPPAAPKRGRVPRPDPGAACPAVLMAFRTPCDDLPRHGKGHPALSWTRSRTSPATCRTGLAVSVCLTPAAPAPLPIPYPTFGSVMEDHRSVHAHEDRGREDPHRGRVHEQACHGNEPGTLKEVVSLNTCGPCFPWLGAPIVFIELGMADHRLDGPDEQVHHRRRGRQRERRRRRGVRCGRRGRRRRWAGAGRARQAEATAAEAAGGGNAGAAPPNAPAGPGRRRAAERRVTPST